MRMIDADALRDKLQNEIDKATPPYDDVIGSMRCGVRLARNIVEDEPTVDAEPVRHGKWIEYPISDGMNQCSECGVLRFGCSNYCPNCGARMDEE